MARVGKCGHKCSSDSRSAKGMLLSTVLLEVSQRLAVGDRLEVAN
jgi:hypothetical protein